jgi:hypothetical protein
MPRNLTRPNPYYHGLSRSYLHRAWSSMKARCYNPKNPRYPNYGGRGILVCDRWLNSFRAFAVDMGHRPSPSHSLDRRDNDGPYSPENCRWSTRLTQARNSRQAVWITIDGESRILGEWLSVKGVCWETYYKRIKRGMTRIEAILTPVDITMSRHHARR